MAMLSKQDILDSEALATEDVDVPEWGGTVRVRELTASERDRLELQVAMVRADRKQGKDPSFDATSWIVGRALIDEDGQRLFTDRELGQLAGKSGRAMERISDVVQRLSGMGPEAVDEAAQDFGDAPTDSSGSD